MKSKKYKLEVKEDSIEMVVKINAKIPEFDPNDACTFWIDIKIKRD